MSAELDGELAPGVRYSGLKGYIMLGVPDPNPQPIELDGVQLHPKGEYHCSLVAARKFAHEVVGAEADLSLVEPEELEHEVAAVETEVVNVVSEYLRWHTVAAQGLTGELYVCHKPNDEGEQQTTIIVGVRVLGLQGLAATLRSEFPQFPDPLAHMTVLKSANSPYGIGVNSAADLAAYCERRDELFTQVLPGAPIAVKH